MADKDEDKLDDIKDIIDVLDDDFDEDFDIRDTHFESKEDLERWLKNTRKYLEDLRDELEAMPNKKMCVIFSGAPECYIPEKIMQASYSIACDSGYAHAKKEEIRPNLIVGDFDSYKGIIPQGVEVIRTVPEKDDTDTLMGLKEAIARGYKSVMMLGAMGGRIDHTLANLALTAYAEERGVELFIIDRGTQIFAIKNRRCRIRKSQWRYVSIFSMEKESRGVTLAGLKYPLDDAVLTNSYPVGVSNEFADDVATIEVKDGMLLIVLTDESRCQ